MSTNSHIRSSAAAVSLAAAALLAAPVRPAAAQQQLQASPCGGARTMLAAPTPSVLHTVQTQGHLSSSGFAYGWPVKPFDRQHPVRKAGRAEVPLRLHGVQDRR